jgi:hypothetical protein
MALGDSCLSGLSTLRDSISKPEKVTDPRTLDVLMANGIGLVHTKKYEREPPRFGSLYASRLTTGQIQKAEHEAPKGLVDTRNGDINVEWVFVVVPLFSSQGLLYEV